MNAPTLNSPKKRLKFIDMARSIAILLMLEGHFIDDSLSTIYRDPDNWIYSSWLFVRGFTAPMFLTVTGLVFVYLLLKRDQEPYFQNIRIKKGFKRVIELFFWGFILQYYAFHVLECIASGIFVILILYGFHKLVKIIPLWCIYTLVGLIIFGFSPWFESLPEGYLWPENGAYFIQNMFHAPSNRAIFPIVPNMGYTMIGAGLGAFLHQGVDVYRKKWFITTMIIIGLSLFYFPKTLLSPIDFLIQPLGIMNFKYIQNDWIFEKVGIIWFVLGLLMTIDKYFGDKLSENNLFLKIGQNTLTIYVLHMILLYGSVIQIGINDFLNKNRGIYAPAEPIYIVIGAILFILLFVVLIYYLDRIKSKLGFVLNPIKRFFNRIFLIQ